MSNKYVQTFEDVLAPPREDGVQWTSVQIEESQYLVGPWALIDTLTWSDPTPATVDPTKLTTHQANYQIALYRATFIDSDGNKWGPTGPVYADGDITSSLEPTISAVGALLRTRTKDDLGNETGTFGSDTRPTAIQARTLIAEAANEVATVIGTNLPVSLFSFTRSLVALRSAMLIELSYFPEQVSSNRSAYTAYERMFEERMKQLSKTVVDMSGGNEDTGLIGDGGANEPYNGFPVDNGGLVGWGTSW